MASEFPILMFGLPGAAIAMICAAEKQNRKKALSIMLSAALVSFYRYYRTYRICFYICSTYIIYFSCCSSFYSRHSN